MDIEHATRLSPEEKAISQKLQEVLWRIAGQYAYISVFDVESAAQLHHVLRQLPLFPYMKSDVRALYWHSLSIRADHR